MPQLDNELDTEQTKDRAETGSTEQPGLARPLTPAGWFSVKAVSYVLTAGALLLVMHANLVSALLAGLLLYSLVDVLAPRLMRLHSRRDAIAVAILSTIILLVLTGSIWALIRFVSGDGNTLDRLLDHSADIIDRSRAQLPAWLSDYLPNGVDELATTLISALREHAQMAQRLGADILRTLVHILVGLIIGAMVALYRAISRPNRRPLALALVDRARTLQTAFSQFIFAQIQISLVNTILTAIYLLVLLPLFHQHLPLSKTLVAITFIAGLLPVLGNLISNTAIVIASLSVSLPIAVVSLLFLVVIHKLEYFLNARIIGARIHAAAWELLTVMLVMETLYGIPGVIAGPIFYAYVKRELTTAGLV
ncbi:AI-2E family transporter [Cupriavidus metallidurans]|uniref:AI-2E family transporter n=1 Tax=Cupriavidus metallidurans TaxID=119219 RepID=UPI000566B646|nr:membrane protein [Cupriavidus metallidurans]